MNFYALVSLFNGIVALATGAYIFLKDRRNSLHASFALFALTVSLWAIFYAVWQWQDSYEGALFYVRLLMVPCYPIPFAFLAFTLTLVQKEIKKSLAALLGAIPFFFMLFGFDEVMIQDVRPKPFFPYWPDPGFLMNVYVIVFGLVLSYCFYLLFRAWHFSSGMRRRQLQWVTLTILFVWLGGSTNWFLWYDIPIPPVPNIAVGICFLLLAYAIVREKLFDIDILADYVHEAKLSALGTLAAGFFHEIRNPLFVAQGYAESLRGQLKGEVRYEEKLEKILKQIERIFEISKRFSEFARPSAAGAARVEDINLKESIEDILSFLGHELSIEKIRIEKEVKPDTRISFDRKHLEEILLNLFVNACHAMPRGGLLKISGETNGRTLIKISDTGEGIAPDKIKRIFDPFFSTKGEKGTGLGLYIVKKLVERNGGKIRVTSEPGRGTTFTLEFRAV